MEKIGTWMAGVGTGAISIVALITLVVIVGVVLDLGGIRSWISQRKK